MSQAINYTKPIPQRSRNTLIGAGFGTAGMLIYFGALLGIYLSERADFLATNSGKWLPDSADIDLTAPTVIMWTLLLSVVTMQWAVYATARNDRSHSLLALVVTALFGAAVINQIVFIFIQMGLEIDSGSTVGPLIYTLLGSFMAAMGAALAFLLVVALRTLGGEKIASNSQVVSSAAIFWDGLVLVYFVLWLAVFVAK